jgi:hypothetical protein
MTRQARTSFACAQTLRAPASDAGLLGRKPEPAAVPARRLQRAADVIGILRVAYKLLVNDKGKFAALLMGYAENGFVVVKDEEFPKLENPTMGTEFEINDKRGVIVGIAEVPASGLFGLPTLYTTYSRAIQYIPSMRFTVSYVLVEPAGAEAVPHIKQVMGQLGYDALTEDEFVDRITRFYMFHTGMGRCTLSGT